MPPGPWNRPKKVVLALGHVVVPVTVLVAFYSGNHGLALYATAIWIALIAIT